MQFNLLLLVVGLFQASLAYPYPDDVVHALPAPEPAEPVPTPAPSTQDSSAQTEVTTKKSWLKEGVDKITNIIKGQASIAKDAVGIAGSGTHMGAQITTAAGQLGTGLGNAALQGGTQIGAMATGAAADLAKQGIDLVNKWGEQLPSTIGKGVQSVAGLAGKVVDQAEKIGKGVLGQVATAGDKGFKWVENNIKGTADSVDSTVNKVTGKVQEGIDKGTNSITSGLDDTLNKLKELTNKLTDRPLI